MTDTLLDTVLVKDRCSLSLYNAIKDFFKEKNIPLNDIIGLGCDNCSSIMGKHSGLQKLFRDCEDFDLLYSVSYYNLLQLVSVITKIWFNERLEIVLSQRNAST